MTHHSRISKGMYWDRAWSLVSGCTHVSAGCDNCWSAKETHMRANNPNEKVKARNEGLTEKGCFNGQIRLNHEFLELPLIVKKPKVWAIWNDLFHEDVPDEFIFQALNNASHAGWFYGHKFLILTKRPERMKAIFLAIKDDIEQQKIPQKNPDGTTTHKLTFHFPLQNIWLGVTAENQEQADKRIPILLQIPAAVRFVSVEPMLGPVDLMNIAPDKYTSINTLEGYGVSLKSPAQSIPNMRCKKLNWVICGGETGHGSRPMHPDWARNLRDQCLAAGVPFFFKQWGEFIVPEDGARACRVCGCTQHNACEGGCWWIEDDLCSECEGKPTPSYRAVKYRRVGKKNAGRLLDGREWNDIPNASSS